MAEITAKVLAVLTEEPQSAGDLADKCGLLARQTGNALQRLKGEGKAKKLKGNRWVRGIEAPAATKGERPLNGNSQVVAAITADRERIILFDDAGKPLFLTPAQTRAVAALVIEHFEAD